MSLKRPTIAKPTAPGFAFRALTPAAHGPQQAEWGLRDVDQATGATVALEFWRASERLPAELLDALPSPVPPADARTGR